MPAKTNGHPAPRLRPGPAAAALAVLVLSGAAAGQGLAVRVNHAVDAAVARLVEQQNADGSFGSPDERHPLGRTALAVLALLHGGLLPDHPAVERALDHIGMKPGYDATVRNRSTYETGLLAVLARALGPGHERTLHRLADWLVEHFDREHGLWAYPDGRPDLSNTQYAALGLRAAADGGYRVPPRLWLRVVEAVLALQDPEGGFRYRPRAIATGSMTHAGLLTLLFAREALGRRAPGRDVARAVKRGHAWYAERYTVERNPMGHGWAPYPGYHFYYLWGLERYGLFFGIDRIDGRDWYAEGARLLLRLQRPDGSFGRIVDTSFAVLFLRKAGITVTPGRRAAASRPASRKAAAKDEEPRPRHGVPFLREWLLLGPFRTAEGMDEMLVTSHVDERRTAPQHGQRAGGATWTRHRTEEDRIDLAEATRGADFACWYAFTWLKAREAREAVLWVASDDGCRVYLDGRLVLDGHHHDGVPQDHYRVPLELRKGPHGLLLKVENVGYHAWFQARLTDPSGGPLEGVIATTRRPR